MNEIEAFVKSVNGAAGLGITVCDVDNAMEQNGEGYTESGVSGNHILDLWYVWKDGVFFGKNN
jgi:hypothetical protein